MHLRSSDLALMLSRRRMLAHRSERRRGANMVEFIGECYASASLGSLPYVQLVTEKNAARTSSQPNLFPGLGSATIFKQIAV